MSRPNAFGVIERVLNLQDSLTEARREIAGKDARILLLQERVAVLQKEITGFDSLLQHSITEKRLLQERLESSDGFRPHPDIPEVTSMVYSGEPKPIHNEHQ